MVKKMDRREKLLFMGAATFVTLSTVALYLRDRIRKRKARITYGPMEERDQERINYLNNRIFKCDEKCRDMLRLNRAPFFRLCQILRERSLLRDAIHVCVEEQVAMFLNTIGHNLRNRVISTNYDRSKETVSRYFRLVLHAIGELRNEFIRPPSLETPTKIAENRWFDPYFKDCIGAIDGTHVRASVSKDMEPSFRGRKSFAIQNVMAAVDFDLRFTYILAGWEGTAHDAVVLADALERENSLSVPQVDAGYGAKPGFLPPFRAVRYHLNEWGSNPVQNKKVLFNLRHSSLRVTVERAFASLKRRFKVLDDATGKYAKSGNDPLSVEVHDIEDDEGANGSGEVNMSAMANVGESSSGSKRPTKRAKVVPNEDDPLLSTLKFGLERVAVALEKAAGANDDISEGLWDELATLPGFDEGHLAHYYAHLVDNPKTAKAFVKLSVSNKLVWVTRYITKNFGA